MARRRKVCSVVNHTFCLSPCSCENAVRSGSGRGASVIMHRETTFCTQTVGEKEKVRERECALKCTIVIPVNV